MCPLIFTKRDFQLKDWNKEKLKEVFADLEFKTLGKRILGEDFTWQFKTAPEAVQTDLFGNIVAPENGKADDKSLNKSEQDAGDGETTGLMADKNINNTPHNYEAIEGDAAIKKLVAALKKQNEICFDTETTGIDANDAELVGLSFAIVPGEAFYIPIPADQEKAKKILAQFESLFSDPSKTWIGQNIKYDMLVLKWYGIEIAGKIV